MRPRRCSSSPQGAKYNTVTQDTSPSRMAEVWGENSFGRAKTGGLGQVTIKKEEEEKQVHERKKKGVTRPRPDGGVVTYIASKFEESNSRYVSLSC